MDAATVLPRATLLSWYILALGGFPWSESKPPCYGSVEGGEDFSHCLTDTGYKARPFASKYDQHSALGVPGVSMGPTSLLSFLPSFIPLLLENKKPPSIKYLPQNPISGTASNEPNIRWKILPCWASKKYTKS